jgi:hypothetical protein
MKQKTLQKERELQYRRGDENENPASTSHVTPQTSLLKYFLWNFQPAGLPPAGLPPFRFREEIFGLVQYPYRGG